MSKHHITKVVSVTAIAKDTFRFRLQLDKMPKITPGQFLNVKVEGFSLRRPFAICSWDEKAKTIDFGFIVRGDGTKVLSQIKAGSTLDVLLPLGNGFDTSAKKIMVIAGGVGVFPLLSVAKNHPDVYSFLGFRSKDFACLVDEFKTSSTETHIASDDGSLGEKGFVTTLARREFDRIKPDAILVCGPEGMMMSMSKTFEGAKTPIYVSLEQRMACGFGACLCCNQQIKVNNQIENLRICCEGPVFKLEEVVWH